MSRMICFVAAEPMTTTRAIGDDLLRQFALLERLNRDPAWRRIPVIVLTAKTLESREVEELGRTCAAVIAKGKDDAGRLADSVLQAAVPRRRAAREALA